MSDIAERISLIQEQMQRTLRQCKRKPDDVRLVAVSKTHPPEAVRAARDCGLRVFGENRVQEAEEKISVLPDPELEWHLIGQLQTNKVKKAISLFRLIHSVDRVKLIQALEQEAEKQQIAVPVLLQINIGDEVTKAGVSIRELEELIEEAKKTRWLRVRGFMTVPPFLDDPEAVRPYFARMREMADLYRGEFVAAGERFELSMGMTHDFPVAIEEGATLVRIGTAIFGSRPSFR